MFVYITVATSRDGSFSSKLQSGSDWPLMGQIRDFFRSDFSTFGSMSQMYWYLIWKSPGFVQFGVQYDDPLWSQTYHPWTQLGGGFLNCIFHIHNSKWFLPTPLINVGVMTRSLYSFRFIYLIFSSVVIEKPTDTSKWYNEMFCVTVCLDVYIFAFASTQNYENVEY